MVDEVVALPAKSVMTPLDSSKAMSPTGHPESSTEYSLAEVAVTDVEHPAVTTKSPAPTPSRSSSPVTVYTSMLVGEVGSVISTEGAVVSRMMELGGDTPDSLPATSVCRTVKETTPVLRSPKVQPTVVDATVDCVHVTPPVAAKTTDPPVSATTVETDGVVSLVISSDALEPVSLAASSVGAEGADGADVSITRAAVAEATDWLPAASVKVAVTE